MYKSILVSLYILTAFSARAQFLSHPYSSGLYPGEGRSLISDARFSLMSGASFTGTHNSSSLFSSWVAPSFSQPVGKNFTISAGALISNTTFSNIPSLNSEGALVKTSSNLTTFTLFAAGTYQVNERLTVSGSAFKTINPAFNARLNPENLQMEARGMSFGIGYRMNDHLHIGAEFRYRQNNGNLYDPYGIQGNSPFFYNGYGGF